MNPRGREAETQAALFLQRRGYKILERNFSVRGGEIDLVAREGKTLCFVEVKSRRSSAFGHPAEAVNWKKQQRLIRAAQVYLLAHAGAAQPACRFDIVSICADEEPQLLRNAFSLAG
jgi:putative endonuclease